MPLPIEIPDARLLITVKTYPNPSSKYDELVCNAGFLESGEWIRLYPIQFRELPYEQQYRKFQWIRLDLKRRERDFRPESYSPTRGLEEPIRIEESIGTGKHKDWRERKKYACREVFDSMQELINLAKNPNIRKSLATVKPAEIVRFEISPNRDREWRSDEQNKLRQMNLLKSASEKKTELKKLPYKYHYHFLSKGDSRPRRMMIEDWEIGALYWNCLEMTDGDEYAANDLVRKKYEDDFLQKDLFFFVGTTLANHHRAPNPFVIIGVFYPPHTSQLAFDF